MTWKQDEKSVECFPTQDQYAFNLPSFNPWGNVSSHLTGFCSPTLLYYFLLSHLHHCLATIQHALLLVAPVLISIIPCLLDGFSHTQSPLSLWTKETKEPGDKGLNLALLWWPSWPQGADSTWVWSSFSANWGQYYLPYFFIPCKHGALAMERP